METVLADTMRAEVAMPGYSNEVRLAEIFTQCAVEMFAEMGTQATRIERSPDSEPSDERLAAFASFGNDELRGSLTVLGPSALFSRLHPLPPTVTPRDLEDWACEIVNQAVGRFRNRMAAYGMNLKCSVPLSTLAELLQLSPSPQLPWLLIQFAIDNYVIECWLEVATVPQFHLAESPLAEIEAALDEGSIILF